MATPKEYQKKQKIGELVESVNIHCVRTAHVPSPGHFLLGIKTISLSVCDLQLYTVRGSG